MSAPVPRALRYGAGTVELPDAPLPLDPVAPPEGRRPSESAARALDRPLGTQALESILGGARRVLVVVSDATRATAASEFLPQLVQRIESGTRADISFIVASGIHRRPTDAEIEDVVTPRLAERYPVIRHDPDDDGSLLEVGRTTSGTLVRVHRAVREHDRLVLTGAAGFHYYAGFSGGRKALVPGLAARETIARNHLRALTAGGARHPRARAGFLHGNPVHRDMAEGAALLEPHLVVNSVVGEDGRLERLFAGHWRQAHEAACRYVRATRRLRVAPRDLVVASAGGEPGDVDLIQAHKTFEAVMGALNPGGVLVLVACCRQGAGHEDFLPWFRFGDESDLVAELTRRFQVYGQTALSWRRKAARCSLVLVSSLSADLVRRLGAVPARDLEEAFAVARERLRSGGRGWLVASGAKLLLESARDADFS